MSTQTPSRFSSESLQGSIVVPSTADDSIAYRLWADGTVQAVEEGPPFSHMSDDFCVLYARDDETVLVHFHPAPVSSESLPGVTLGRVPAAAHTQSGTHQPPSSSHEGGGFFSALETRAVLASEICHAWANMREMPQMLSGYLMGFSHAYEVSSSSPSSDLILELLFLSTLCDSFSSASSVGFEDDVPFD